MKERIDKTREIYEHLRAEYNALPQEERYRFRFSQRLLATVQTTLVVSERKAKEYVTLIRETARLDNQSSNT